MMKSLRRLAAIAALGALVFGFTGCDQEEGNSRLIPEVVSFNENAPLASDVWHLNGTPDDPFDDYVPIDWAEIVIKARVADPALALSTNTPFGNLHFTSYRVQFIDGVNSGGADLNGDGTIDLENYEAPMNLMVPAGGTAVGAIEIVPIQAKLESPISDTRGGGTYRTSAIVTFIGKEETSGRDIETTRGLDVTIGNLADE